MGRKSRSKARKLANTTEVTVTASKLLRDGDGVETLSSDSILLPARKINRLDLLGMLILVALIGVALFPAVLGGFVWDDRAFTEAVPVMSNSGLYSIWLSPADLPSEGHYWPITYTTFWLEHKLWGYTPLPYHIFNLILHSINSCLVFYLLWRLAVPGAWLAAAVFAIHPVHVEPVAWVIGRKDLLSTMFCLCLFLVWMRFRESPKPVLWRYVLTLVLFVAALFSKSTIVALPVVLLIWQWWKGERVQVRHLLWVLPFFVIGLVYSYLDFSFYTSREKVDFDLSLLDRFMLASQAFWFYILKLVWPSSLSIIYPLWQVGVSSVYSWLSLVGALGLAGVLWWFRDKTGKGYLAGLLFFVLLLMPMLGFIDYGYMQFAYAADRYQYLASVGVIVILCSLAVMGSSKLPLVMRKGMIGIAVVVLATFGYLSWQQAKHYENEITLFSHIISLNPDARSAYSNLSGALADFGRFEESLENGYLAIESDRKGSGGYAVTGAAHIKLKQYVEAEDVLRRGFEINSKDKSIGVNLGESLRLQARYEEALPYYRHVIKRNPDFVNARVGIGASLYHLKQYEESIEHMKHALSLESTVSLTDVIHSHLGLAYMKLDQLESAEFHLRQANSLKPNDHLVLRHLGDVVKSMGQFDEAIQIYDAVRQLNPDVAAPYIWIGQALFDMKKFDDARVEFERALEIDSDAPWVASVYVLLANVDKETNNREGEIKNYELALQHDPRSPEAVVFMANLRNQQGRFEEAERFLRIVLEIEPENASAHAALGLVLLRLGRTQDGIELLDQALALDPSIEEARIERDRALANID